MQWIGLNIIMRKNETCRAARYSLSFLVCPLRFPLTSPLSATPVLSQSPRPKKLRAQPLKPKSRKFGPFPAVPPSTTPRGMHFSYPRDIIAPAGCINRFGKGNITKGKLRDGTTWILEELCKRLGEGDDGCVLDRGCLERIS